MPRRARAARQREQHACAQPRLLVEREDVDPEVPRVQRRAVGRLYKIGHQRGAVRVRRRNRR